jgi:hypothetical protein
MWRRYYFHSRLSGIRSPKPIRRLLILAAILAFGLTVVAAFAQDSSDDAGPQTAPPPPADMQTSPDQTAAQSTVRAVRLSDVEGQVQVFQQGNLVFPQAEPNMPAVEGMRFVTGDNGRLEIEFEDGSVARVAPNSSIRLTELGRSSDGATTTQIDALTGLTYYELSPQGGKISVHFNADAVTPVGSAVFRIALDAAPNELAVMHGAVHVDDGQGVALDVHPNQTFQTDPQQPGEFTVAQSVTADSWDQWNSDRDEALAELESNETTARASSGNPDDPAWNDLDYYGNWYNLPGYGQVWAPSGVDADWDPFGSGYWGYYPSFGYTWISGYPWGWWPYHCGAWDYLPAWGWVWVPGNCGWGFYGAGWYPYATVWRVPRNYVPPTRPRHGPGPLPHPTPLIAVNRGPQYGAPFHEARGPRPAPRVLSFDGKTIAPLDASIHPAQRGPLGETYSATLVRTHPEMATSIPRTIDGRTGISPVPGARPFSVPAGPARPAGTFTPRGTSSSSGAHPSGGGGGGGHVSSGGGGGGGHAGGGGGTSSTGHH